MAIVSNPPICSFPAPLEYDENGIPYYKFPPFPEAPPGVTIMSFQDFKPSGIQIMRMDEDEVELDGKGIPTIDLKVKHDLNRPPVKKKKAKTHDNKPVIRPPWYEDWADGESLRSNFSYNRNLPREDRLAAVADDFQRSRTWPDDGELKKYYERIRFFIGLSGVNMQRFVRRFKETEDIYPDEESDGEDNPMIPKDPQAAKMRIDAWNDEQYKLADRSEYRESDEYFKKRVERDLIEREIRMEAFLANPELVMKKFFSSYFRNKGMLWSKIQVRHYPILMLFFLRFIVRNKAFPELNRELQKAIAVVEKAKAELAKTMEIGKKMPDSDELAACCIEIFGSQLRKLTWETRPLPDDADAEEHQSKKTKLDATNGEESGNRVEDVEAEFKADLEAAGASLISSEPVGSIPVIDPAPLIAREATEEATIVEVEDGAVTSAGNTTAFDWAAAEAEANANASWGGQVNLDDNPWADSGAAAQGEWTLPVHNLMSLLGPCSLPLTHKVGYVEESTRHVVSWSLPSPPLPVSDQEGTQVNNSDPFRRFARVHLAPYQHISTDPIAAIREPELISNPLVDKVDGKEPDLSVQPHDPKEDIITILVDAKATEFLFEGMGIGGTFVQLVPTEPDSLKVTESASGSGTPGRSNAKRGKKNTVDTRPQTWWYAEKAIQFLPSFWSEAKD